MKRYMKYETSYDEKNQTFCCTGFDNKADIFGVGAGSTVFAAKGALINWINEVLEDSIQYLDDMSKDKPTDTENFIEIYLVLTILPRNKPQLKDCI